MFQDKRGHWIWDGNYKLDGLPTLHLEDPKGKTCVSARRIAYELYRGEVPINQWVFLTCKEESCVNPAHLRVGPKKGVPQKLGLKGRFEKKFQRGLPDECWIWQGAQVRGGYGQIGCAINGRHIMAHRLSYELYVGSVEGLHILHKEECGNRLCMNPAHLYSKKKKISDKPRQTKHS